MKPNHPSDDHLIAYSLEEIESELHDSIAAHVAGCEVCTQTVSSLTQALEAFRSEALPPTSADTLVSLLEAQAAHTSRRRSLWSSINPFRLVPALALLAVLFLAGFVAGRGSLFPPMGSRGDSAQLPASQNLHRFSETALFQAAASEATLFGGIGSRPEGAVPGGRDSL